MKLPFAKNTKRNLLAGYLNQMIGLLFPFLNRTLFLWLLGPEFLGLNGLFRSVIGMMSLAELGVNTAIVSSMYKPIADDDQELVCAYLAFFRTVYRWIGTIVLLIGLCLMPFLRHLIHGSLPPGINLHVLFLIHLGNTVLSYFLFAYRGPVLTAYHRNDVSLHINTITQTIQYVVVFFVLLFTRNYYAYIATTVFFTALKNLVVLRESVRLFPHIAPRGRLCTAARRRIRSDVRSIFLHKIGGVITGSADNIVVSAFLGLSAVAVYGNYYYVLASVAGLIAVLNNATQSGFGNRLHTESQRKNFVLFMRMTRVTMMVTACCAAMMASLYQPFIAIWTKHDPALLRHALTPILMVFHFYVAQSRQTLLMFKGAAGIWQEDRWKPIVAGMFNLALNLSFVLFLPEEYKLDGVIFSTTISFICIQIPWESHAFFSRYFGWEKARAYWAMHARSALATGVLCASAWWISRAVTVPGIPGFIFRALVAAAVIGALLSSFFFRGVNDAIDFIRKKT